MNHELRKNYQITIDDVGYDAASTKLVARAVEAGAVQNLAVMTTMPGSTEVLGSLATWQKRHPTLQIGLHLNLTEGKSLSKPSEISSLLRSDGTLWPWPTFVRRLVLGQIQPDQVAIEANRQYEQLAKIIPALDFFNSHHHIHLWPGVARILTPIIPNWNLWAVRRPRRFFWPTATFMNLLKALLIQSFGQRVSYPLTSLTAIYADLDWAGPEASQRARLLRNLPPETELGCHPHAFLGGESSLEWLLRTRD